MADGVFNIAKGRIAYYAGQAGVANAALTIVLLKVAEADDTLNNHDDLGALIVGANTEADFTNYARKQITSSTPTVDDTGNDVQEVIADQTWTAAGGATNNTLVKLLVCYDGDTTTGTDANIVPLTYHDFAVTTDSNDLTADFDGTNGFWGSA